MKISATEILRKLKVSSGLRMGTVTVSRTPYIVVDMFYSRDREIFCIRLNWSPGKSKTIGLKAEDVTSKSKSPWMTEKTYRLTEECITRLSDGLESAIAAIYEVRP